MTASTITTTGTTTADRGTKRSTELPTNREASHSSSTAAGSLTTKATLPQSQPPTEKTRYRSAFIEFASQHRFTHWLTLNTHRDCSMATAHQRLKRWHVEVLRHVHGAGHRQRPQAELFMYLGSPERSLAGHPHFHLAVVVPVGVTAKFEAAAARRWLAIVPGGTCDIQVIGPTASDQRTVLGYAAKWLDQSSDLPFIDSRLFR